jgi:hypothetical protein
MIKVMSGKKYKFDPNAEQNTIPEMLKMIKVMATEKYKYNPRAIRSTVPEIIVREADLMDIKFTGKTVRDWLKKAVEEE